MFKIEDLYVDDKQLGNLLKAIAGIARGMPRPVPMIDVEPDRDNTGNLIGVYTGYLAKTHAKEITATDVKVWLAKNGRSKLSYGYILKGLMKVGAVKRNGKIYTVQKAKA